MLRGKRGRGDKRIQVPLPSPPALSEERNDGVQDGRESHFLYLEKLTLFRIVQYQELFQKKKSLFFSLRAPIFLGGVPWLDRSILRRGDV